MIAQAMEQWGRVDVLVNNAGIAVSADFLDTTEAQFRKVLDVNLVGVFLATQRAAKGMVAEGEGEMQEGCLSIPDVYETVKRPAEVRVRAVGRDGEPYEMDADGLLAVCIQHEIDHLEGKLFVDYLSPLKRNRIRRKMEKRLRDGDFDDPVDGDDGVPV